MRRSIKVSGGRVWIKMIYAGGGRKQQVKTNRLITADKTTQSGPQPGAASLPAGEWRLFVCVGCHYTDPWENWIVNVCSLYKMKIDRRLKTDWISSSVSNAINAIYLYQTLLRTIFNNSEWPTPYTYPNKCQIQCRCLSTECVSSTCQCWI